MVVKPTAQCPLPAMILTTLPQRYVAEEEGSPLQGGETACPHMVTAAATHGAECATNREAQGLPNIHAVQCSGRFRGETQRS